MQFPFAREYALKFMEEDGDDAFHSLIECGDEALGPIEELLSRSLSNEQYQRLMDALAEIRTPRGLQFLGNLVRQPWCPRWKWAAKALIYHSTEHGEEILRRLLRELSQVPQKTGHSVSLQIREIRDLLQD